MRLCANCNTRPVFKVLVLAVWGWAGEQGPISESVTPIPLCLECGGEAFRAVMAALPNCSAPTTEQDIAMWTQPAPIGAPS